MEFAEDSLSDVLPAAHRVRLESALADALEGHVPDMRVPLANAVLGASAYLNTLVASALRRDPGNEYTFEDVVPGVLRVATCDLALRAGAAAAVFGLEVPDTLPRFADPRQRAFPAEEVGRALECQTLDDWANHFPRSTAGEWLGGSVPSVDNLPALAAPVARRSRRAVADVIFGFRSFYALRELTDLLRGAVADLDPLLLFGCRLARRATALLRDEAHRRRIGPLMLWGLQFPAAPELLRALAEPGDHPSWRFALRAVAEDPFEYLRYCSDVECAGRESASFFSVLAGGSAEGGRLIGSIALDQFLGDGPALDPRFMEALAPADRAGLLDLAARRARLSGDRERALALLKKAMATAPEDALTIVSYAWALAQSGDRKRAVRLFRDAARLRPGWDLPDIEIARVQLEERSAEADERALSHLDSIRSRVPWSPEFGHVLGLSLIRARRYDEASECFERLLADNPRDPTALDRAALCDLARSRGNRALHTRGVQRAKEALALGARDTYRAWRAGEFRAE
jgi:tetratricopeptide (TPR) repeat protein